MATHAERRAGTQAAVMKAARKLFGERGFAATSVDDIASASRLAKGAISAHADSGSRATWTKPARMGLSPSPSTLPSYPRSAMGGDDRRAVQAPTKRSTASCRRRP